MLGICKLQLALLQRELLVDDLTEIIAKRLDVDSVDDPRPYLAATTWAAHMDWFRTRALAQRTVPRSADEPVDDFIRTARQVWATSIKNETTT